MSARAIDGAASGGAGMAGAAAAAQAGPVAVSASPAPAPAGPAPAAGGPAAQARRAPKAAAPAASEKIYARSVDGLYARWRVVFVALTQALFYGLPWLNWNGRQAVLFDLGARKFYLFGLVLGPQDVVYLTVLLVISALSLFLFTAIAGRLFCGYACPQTVYSEIFAWIETKVEGDRSARLRLDASPWSLRKLRLKAAKHALWLAVAWWTGSTFVGYFAPIRGLGSDLLAGALGPWQWFWIVFYSLATWGNAGFLRTTVCKYMCPYARFQSVMVDPDTYVVTYDRQRGEPRGHRSRRAAEADGAAPRGDCVDCTVCVQVCPTGIDIRDGLQYMCIGCGACIDACDQVMEKMEYPVRLIRYTSERAMRDGLSPAQARRRLLRPRVLVYAALILLLAAGLAAALVVRSPLRMDVMRDRGVMGREVAGGLIENVYRVQFINTAESPLRLTLHAEGLPGLSAEPAAGQGEAGIEVPPVSNRLLAVVMRAPAGAAEPGLYPVRLQVRGQTGDGRTVSADEAASFYMPR